MKNTTNKTWESKIPELIHRLQNPITPADTWEVTDELMRMARMADAKHADMTAILYNRNITKRYTSRRVEALVGGAA